MGLVAILGGADCDPQSILRGADYRHYAGSRFGYCTAQEGKVGSNSLDAQVKNNEFPTHVGAWPPGDPSQAGLSQWAVEHSRSIQTEGADVAVIATAPLSLTPVDGLQLPRMESRMVRQRTSRLTCDALCWRLAVQVETARLGPNAQGPCRRCEEALGEGVLHGLQEAR